MASELIVLLWMINVWFSGVCVYGFAYSNANGALLGPPIVSRQKACSHVSSLYDQRFNMQYSSQIFWSRLHATKKSSESSGDSKSKSNKVRVRLCVDIKGFGRKGDIVLVSHSFWQNMLFPRQQAEKVTEEQIQHLANLKISEQNRFVAFIESLQSQLKNAPLSIQWKVNENIRLFGAVTSKVVIDELRKYVTQNCRESIQAEWTRLDTNLRSRPQLELYPFNSNNACDNSTNLQTSLYGNQVREENKISNIRTAGTYIAVWPFRNYENLQLIIPFCIISA